MKKQKMLFNSVQQLLLKWIQIILLGVCGVVFAFILLTDSQRSQTLNSYLFLVQGVLVLLGISHYLYRQKKFAFSSRLLVLAGVIGPWGSAIFDLSIPEGNLFPLVYLTIPIIFSGFFTPIMITAIVGAIQIGGLTIFTILNQIELSGGVSSLFFFIIFIFAISLIFNIINRYYQRIIDEQTNKLQKLALTDQLTGLYNRHFLSEFLKKEFAQTKRIGGELSIVLLDIDDFKKYNDNLGHACGDSILKGLSILLLENFRSADVVCRFGGDEFLIAMRGSKALEAQKRCEDLFASISAKNMKCTIKLNKPLKLSIGIAAYCENHKSEKDLIKAADNALYRAKELGKNRIELADT